MHNSDVVIGQTVGDQFAIQITYTFGIAHTQSYVAAAARPYVSVKAGLLFVVCSHRGAVVIGVHICIRDTALVSGWPARYVQLQGRPTAVLVCGRFHKEFVIKSVIFL